MTSTMLTVLLLSTMKNLKSPDIFLKARFSIPTKKAS